MDRLLCGDVGYGKTEVAMRAAFKAVMDGKQVAVLCPTTVLASQHFKTFADRMALYPVRVAALTRLPSRRPSRPQVVEELQGRPAWTSSSARTGCSPKDVAFRDLGLLVIDEEQRFGVAHKEKIKQMQDGRRRADADRHAHPADAATCRSDRPARHQPDRDAAQGPAGRPHRGHAVRPAADRRGRSSASSPAAARSTTSTTAIEDMDAVAGQHRRRCGAARPGSSSVHGQMAAGRAREARCSISSNGATTCWSRRRSSRTASTSRTSTP